MRHGSAHADVIVIGAGIVGAACAEALTRDDRRVLVLDERVAGGGATGAAMGHLVVMDDSPAQLALTAYSLRMWRAVQPQFPDAIEHLACGTLWIAGHEEEMSAVRAKHDAYAAAGVPSTVLDRGDLAEAEPALRPDLAGALLVPDDSVIYPPAAARWLLARVLERGGEIREGVAVTGIAAHRVETSDGPLEADAVILAAGCGAAALVPELPIVPRKGHLIVTDRYPGLVRHQLVELGYLASAHATDGSSVAFNVQPRSSGQLLIGSSRQHVGTDASIDRDIVGRMVARATHFVPALRDAMALRVWTGFRPATADSLPLIGRWPALDGVFVAAGHEGLGVTTALGTARVLADLVAGREPALDPLPFAPDRSMARTGDRVHA